MTPDKGLEPLTSGLKVPRSTDWANRAYLNCAMLLASQQKCGQEMLYYFVSFRRNFRPIVIWIWGWVADWKWSYTLSLLPSRRTFNSLQPEASYDLRSAMQRFERPWMPVFEGAPKFELGTVRSAVESSTTELFPRGNLHDGCFETKLGAKHLLISVK